MIEFRVKPLGWIFLAFTLAGISYVVSPKLNLNAPIQRTTPANTKAVSPSLPLDTLTEDSSGFERIAADSLEIANALRTHDREKINHSLNKEVALVGTVKLVDVDSKDASLKVHFSEGDVTAIITKDDLPNFRIPFRVDGLVGINLFVHGKVQNIGNSPVILLSKPAQIKLVK